MSSIKLFESQKIRSQWDAEKEKWYFSVVDIIEVLTESPRPRKYWNALKTKLQEEGSSGNYTHGYLVAYTTTSKLQSIDWLNSKAVLRISGRSSLAWR
jgi:DNA-damage-inducible protein D